MGEKAKILILGTYHFDKGGKHLIDFDPEDITTAKKQSEINEVIQKLMEFKPNKISVEAKIQKEEELNKAYSHFCVNSSVEANEVIGHRNEIVQIAFRLAHKLNHNKIYPVDVPVDLPEDVFEYAEKNCPSLYGKFINRANEYGLSENEFMQKHTVNEILRHLNDPARIETEHSDLYLYLNQIGAGYTYYGVNTLTEWYKRNLYIFANLQNITKPEDRILVLYGAGHCKILRDFIKDYSEFEFVDPLDYL
ncbi:hypothetical protein JK636_01975 [Clostridium sp. YIM B02515]|uniref:Uncharacterized protein n=1 Tax=Clostridium rhizosphaerae TaxID=2803861 RepID=A0ABS1T6Y6_9CLOT|nr:DUF5694 domain-containing protein [Clostridium rhizosphaerae]MBL4934522.1 hypothetical protein [Clostridium rhizosphaerae]